MQYYREESQSGWMKKNYAVGWIALSIYAFTWLINFDVSRAAESVFILCFIIAWFTESDFEVKWHKIFLLLIAFVAIQVGVYFFAVERFPSVADEQVKAARQIAKLFLCIAVAWWLRGSIIASKYLLTVFLASVVVFLLINLNGETWKAGISGGRVDFGFTNAQHAAFYMGLILIMGLSWLFKCLANRVNKLEWGLALTLILLGLVGVVVTQTRAIWLALALVLVGLVAVSLLRLLKQIYAGKLRAKVLLPLFVLAAVVAYMGSTMAPVIEKRLSKERDVIEAIAEGRLADVPLSSIGIRVHTWLYGWEKIQERPWMGWGAKSRNALIDEGPFPDWLKQNFGHFHNGYLEILLAYGVLGLSALVILTLIILTGTIRLLGSAHHHWGMGILVSWVFFFIINVFESYLIFNSGMYFFIIVGGVGVSFYLFGNNKKTNTLKQ